MPLINLTPTKLPDVNSTFFTSKIDYPSVTPWDANYPALTSFTASFGNANIDSVLRLVSGTIYNGFYYNLENRGYLRATFSVDALDATYSPSTVYYHEQSGKILCAFTKTIDAQNIGVKLYVSDSSYGITDGDKGTIAMSLVYNGIVNGSFGIAGAYIRGYAIAVWPGNGPLDYGICISYTVPGVPNSAYDWGFGAFVQLPSNTLYCVNSCYNSPSLGQRSQALINQPGAGVRYNGGNNYTIWQNFSNSSVCVSSSDVSATYTFDSTTYQLQMPFDQYQPILDGFKSSLNDGNWAVVGRWGYMVAFSRDFTSYWHIVPIGGDQLSSQFFSTNPLTPAIGGYSTQDGAILYSRNSSSAPLIFTNSQYTTVQLMGPGPILPILSLPCQNFCLPMFRMKKI